MNAQTIIRTPKDGDRKYFSMDRAVAQDDRLSWEARGLLAYLLSKPSDWEVRVIDLQQNCGRDKVYRMLKELHKLGYLEPPHQVKQPDGKFGWSAYIVHEAPIVTTPASPVPEKPDMVAPCPEKPCTGKPYTANTDANNKREELNTDNRKEKTTTTPVVVVVPARETDVERPNIYGVYEANVGALTAIIGQELKDLCAEYSEPWVTDAIKLAVLHEKRSLSYVKGILRNWQRDGRGVKPSAPNGNGRSAAPPGFVSAIPRAPDELQAVILAANHARYLREKAAK